MAGIITHLVIGNEIIKEFQVHDANGFYLGSIAPDAIMAKPNYIRENKKETHLRVNISSENWYKDEYQEIFAQRTKDFIQTYFNNPPKFNSFYFGYVIHLLTDQYFHNHVRTYIINKLKKLNLQGDGMPLLKVMTYEFDTMDYYLLNQYPIIITILNLIEKRADNYFVPNLLSNRELKNNFKWINNKFAGKSVNLSYKYLTENKIKAFIEDCINEILNKLNEEYNEIRKNISID